MQRLKVVLLIVFSGVLFTALFYRQDLGLNLLIFEAFLLLSLVIINKAELRGRLVLVTLSGTILTAVLVVIHNSALSITANFISIFLFFGIIIFPQLRNLSYAPLLAAYSLFKSQGSFIKLFSEGNAKVTTAVRYLKIFGIPIIVFFIFMLIYKVSNPIFEKYTDSVAEVISRWVTSLFENINIPLLLTFIMGLFLSNFFFLGKANQAIVNKDMSGSDTLVRKRRKHIFDFRKAGLIYEYKTGVFLFVILNLLLLVVNTIDVYWVWFNFEWNGQYLKQFVHEGTYLLIFSVLLSIVLTLYFFRGNLNFLKNNKWLIRLSKLWLLQNAILVVSVAIRNFWYIHYFALAYKRIGVIFFLIAILFSLYFVFRKIEFKKSSWYLFRVNSLAIYVILVSMTLFNWDVIIAKYNFSHYKTSFVHLDFLSGLSDKALPYLDVPKENLKEISAEQLDRFSSSFSRNRYMTPEEYYKHIQWRKKRFLREWPERSWLSWNLADWRAYNILTKKQGAED
jgi:hypothetical protein